MAVLVCEALVHKKILKKLFSKRFSTELQTLWNLDDTIVR